MAPVGYAAAFNATPGVALPLPGVPVPGANDGGLSVSTRSDSSRRGGRRLLTAAAVALALSAACSPAAPPAPTVAPTAAPKPTTASAPPAAAATAAPATKPAAAVAPFDASKVKTFADLNDALKGRPAAERRQILLDGVQKAPGFQLYSTMNAKDAQAIVDGFNKAFPSVKADVFRASDGDLVNKILTEARAQKTLFDVMDVSPEAVATMIDQKVATPYSSLSTEGIDARFRDPDGYWNYMYLNGTVVAWNTDRVKGGDVPKSYEDLLQPRWKDKISIDNEDYIWAYFIKQTMGEAKGSELLKKLAAQSPHVMKGRTNQLNLLTAGEFDASIALFDYSVIETKKKGAPIDYRYMRPTLVQGEAVMVNRAAAHPYAAMLYVDWLLSQEGLQTLADATGRSVPRSDVKLKNPEMSEQTKGEVWVQPVETGKMVTQLQKDYVALFK